ncbi:QcrA and Rieske domain-containing protein [Thermodesulfatator atlanticus]|uniref:QcrA and Rieske domain-containing protein n=1 Tax=Thermodesulfatator atlanticus TaxID=501497 RepID=UPI0003B396A0|nr:Rieske (2Fe-2S) protein [Thermodesulfatator atlanticus]
MNSSRRNFLKLLGKVFLGGLFLTGIGVASGLIPRPPLKVFLKKESLKKKEIYIGEDFFLVLKDPKKPLALSRRCPHLGCTVNYDPQHNLFICPCHQSRFTTSGRYLSGPAKRDLFPLAAKVTEGGIIIELPG